VDATIVTNCPTLAKAIQGCGYRALHIEPGFIEPAAEPFDESLELQFRTTKPGTETTLKGLRGKVVCAIPPGLHQGEYLFDVMYSAHEGHVVYAPLLWIRAPDLRKALEEAKEVDPWFLTSIAAAHAVNAVLGRRLATLQQGPKAEYLKWPSLFYLQLIRDVQSPAWLRCLYFGNCRAEEIDCFGGTVRHRRRPAIASGPFQVIQRETTAQWPEPRQHLNSLLRAGTLALEGSLERLENAFRSGACSWPFLHDTGTYEEEPIQMLPEAHLDLGHKCRARPAQKITRIYCCGRLRFRSISYRLDAEEINPIPSKAPFRATVEPDLPRDTVEGLLDRLDGYRVGLDLPDLMALSPRYLRVDGRKLSVTQQGYALLRKAEEAGVTFARLYLVLRLLEKIQSEEMSYHETLQLLLKLFPPTGNADERRGTKMEA
jgi:hypothetical protein